VPRRSGPGRAQVHRHPTHTTRTVASSPRTPASRGRRGDAANCVPGRPVIGGPFRPNGNARTPEFRSSSDIPGDVPKKCPPVRPEPRHARIRTAQRGGARDDRGPGTPADHHAAEPDRVARKARRPAQRRREGAHPKRTREHRVAYPRIGAAPLNGSVFPDHTRDAPRETGTQAPRGLAGSSAAIAHESSAGHGCAIVIDPLSTTAQAALVLM
jgi:hypothetical protein